jgi:TPR repeat protein
VSNFDDNSDYPKTLPSPELNPLTNPVLGKHMGRWAEVYFTSPPEKREQAVQELLRELQRDSSGGEASAQATAVPSEAGNAAEEGRTFPSAPYPAPYPANYLENFPENSSTATNSETAAATSRNYSEVSPGLAAPLREEFIQCRGCGRLALVEQKFCGACGSALPVRDSVPEEAPRNGNSAEGSATPEPGLELAAQAARVGAEDFEEDAKIGEEEFEGPKDDQKDDQKIDLLPTPVESLLRDRELIWAQGVKPITDDVPRLFLEQQRARQQRARWLMGAALAILVGTLFYVGARGTAAWLRAHEVAQNAAAKGDSTAGRTSSPLSGASSSESPLPAPTPKRDDVAPAVVVHALSPTPAGYSPARRDDKRNPAGPNGPGAGASTQKSIAPTNAADEKLNPLGDRALADHALADHAGHGAEELAIAESYLSGTQGKARDSSEAAQWLWKAVGKQNAAAALLLSDLYVTGDGVSRNCDQARLLLDAAARKGVPGAGERIRDLPNLGCE